MRDCHSCPVTAAFGWEGAFLVLKVGALREDMYIETVAGPCEAQLELEHPNQLELQSCLGLTAIGDCQTRTVSTASVGVSLSR